MNNLVIKYKTLLSNLSYLTLLQVFNMVLPLVIYPYLIRVLGANVYGTLVFAFAIVAYFSSFINFGFNISSTREIAENIGDNYKLSKVVSGVYIIKIVLWITSLLIYVLIISYVNFLRKDYILYLASFSMTLYELLFPQFFFQGIQKMRYITFLTFLTKSVFFVLIILFVKNEGDYLLVPILNGIGAIASGVISLLLIKKEGISFVIPNISELQKQIKNSFLIFSTKITLIIRDKTSVVVLGSFFSPSIVAFYDLAVKLVDFYLSMFQVIPTSVLPKLIESKDRFLSRMTLYLTILGGILFFLVIQLFGEELILFLGGKDMMQSVIYLRYISILGLVSSINTLLNYFFISVDKEIVMFRTIVISILVFVFSLSMLFLYKSIWVVISSLIVVGILELLLKLRFKSYISNII